MKYRHYINSEQVFPKNGGIELYKYEKSSDPGATFRFELDSDIVFDYNDPGFDFKAQEESNLCDEHSFTIQRKCGPIWTIFWEGLFTIAEGQFDDANCLYTIRPRRKEFISEDVSVNIFNEPNRLIEDSVDGITATRPIDGATFTWPNWRYFDSLVLFIAKKANPRINSLISNFFQINPDGAFYLPFTNHWTKMAFTSISSIKDPVPSDEATIELITFRQLMSDLAVLFQVQWRIDENYNLRIEHDVFFDGTIGLDLTTERYVKYLKKKTQHSYSLDDYYKKETFKIAEHRSSCQLTYSGLSSIAKNRNEQSYTTQIIRTGWIEAFDSTNNGVFLIATDGGTLTGEWRALHGGSPAYELYLNPYYLVTTVHKYFRPSLYALISYYQNNKDTAVISAGLIMESVKPTKEQEEVTVPLCCDDEFNVSDQVKTDIGIGYITKASFNAKSELLKLSLKYKVESCNDFQPDQFDCKPDLWLKYNDLLYDTPAGAYPTITTAYQWNDSSGNARHAVQALVADKPFFVPDSPCGSAVQFYNLYDPGPVLLNGRHLKTPAFQLFPNKRGTIFIVFNSGFGDFGGTGIDLIGAAPGGSILSTQDGGADDYFDLSTTSAFHSNAEAKNYPALFPYIGTPVAAGSCIVSNSVMVIRRSSDISLDISWNGVPSSKNPMIIANDQPDSKPLFIGYNQDVQFFSTAINFMSEIIVYPCALTDDQIEKVLFYMVKKKLITL